jgi:hypothetical protein
LRAEITIITNEEGKSIPQLSDKKWVKVIAFIVDKMAYLKEVNIKFKETLNYFMTCFLYECLAPKGFFFERELA